MHSSVALLALDDDDSAILWPLSPSMNHVLIILAYGIPVEENLMFSATASHLSVLYHIFSVTLPCPMPSYI
jgi:hypothetical protein